MCDVDGYFSSPTTSYVIYENTLSGVRKSDSEKFDAQIAALKTALMIVTVLDRVLILPRFHCLQKSSFVDCPLNSLLRITPFDNAFATRYRASNFLRHPLVPDAVRRSVSPLYFLANTTNTSNTTTVAVQHSMFDDELKQLLAADLHRVLSLASLDHIRVTFRSSSQQTSFDKTLTESFKRSDYRQLT